MKTVEHQAVNYFLRYNSSTIYTVKEIEVIEQVDRSGPLALYLVTKKGLILTNSDKVAHVYFKASDAVDTANKIAKSSFIRFSSTNVRSIITNLKKLIWKV